nr:WAS/WASL-interacting protein family member 1 [Oryctolagus cuniculus]
MSLLSFCDICKTWLFNSSGGAGLDDCQAPAPTGQKTHVYDTHAPDGTRPPLGLNPFSQVTNQAALGAKPSANGEAVVITPASAPARRPPLGPPTAAGGARHAGARGLSRRQPALPHSPPSPPLSLLSGPARVPRPHAPPPAEPSRCRLGPRVPFPGLRRRRDPALLPRRAVPGRLGPRTEPRAPLPAPRRPRGAGAAPRPAA